ncbi:MAG: ACP S-malonyltransferase [Desulfatibacillum sp.]|nr:ACP S-malonyltransferase [Desulfatibacillum sp.]
MKKAITAIVFPGQGSQRPGMGKDFFEQCEESAMVYDEASQALGWDVAELCFGDDEKLNLTEFAQPCIVTTEIAMLRALKSEFDLSPDFWGGHSLGEYTALVGAEVLPLSAAVKIVQARGRLMQAACPVGMGAMAAIIGKDLDAKVLAHAMGDLPVDLANINSPDQVVISGQAKFMDQAQKRIEDALNGGAPRFVPLNVSAPFHSRFMKGIEKSFRQVLEQEAGEIRAEGAARVACNYTGGFHIPEASAILDALVAQLSNPVQWTQNMGLLAKAVDDIVELGANRPLRGFFKAMGVECQSITGLAAAHKRFAA